ncbi:MULTISPECIES: HlyD family efflux transporter periplasmic adaptor subunit [unclassified Pseudodesulfovibrio]|uniref:HlyD family secretion protein n=1 Tax=unclassified Pseudodesulfovibrio TaxID=2661612 RepID=UPI000FEBEAFF|nr:MULTISPECIES: HlyD family efflux transporter periplasmic adaptor subunit [unclassified Pseudodesulfovibrio]MCJ2163818.1 HlyD family efflux transporter periplasmic adaptor subunit [Pseudodesulfovibrio sp. S3-i]RWU06104.1 HlyD family efflux transporter periplasmic adaptor subunit [Pseudodesulfovibrio sp. S3]
MNKNALFMFAICTLLSLAACSSEPQDVFQGYVEGEYVHVAAPIGGTLDELNVTRGQTVSKDAPLFGLERDFEKAAVDEATHDLQRAQDNLANLEKGQRPTEIASIQARLRQAKAAADLAKVEYKRRVQLIAEETISQEELDRSKSDYDQKKQQVSEINSELQTAGLGARSDVIRAAASEIMQKQAKLVQALWNYNQKVRTAPSSAFVFDTLFRMGEWVPSGQAVVSLLPPENIEIRFYVPQTIVSQIQTGQKAIVTYDGAEKPVDTTISYISPSAEFTPPVIYSSQSRAKLVFMLKARPSQEDAEKLHPGQPVDVTIPTLVLQ